MFLRKLFPILLLSAVALQAQNAPDLPDQITGEIFMKHWEQAAQLLDRAEKEGRCKEAVCLAWRARIAEGKGDGAQALALARRAAALFGPDSGLKAVEYNEVGAILYRHGPRDAQSLKLVETAFRQADSIYKGDASNIRFNLATVLKAQGRTKEAKKIMDALEAEGMLIEPSMAVLGGVQAAGDAIAERRE